MKTEPLHHTLKIREIALSDAKQLLVTHHPNLVTDPSGWSQRIWLAYGVFFKDILEGALVWGRPANNPSCRFLGGTQESILEFFFMWLSDTCPINSESRAIMNTIKLIEQKYPQYIGALTYNEWYQKATAHRATGWTKATSSVYKGERYFKWGRLFPKYRKWQAYQERRKWRETHGH